MCHEWLIYLLTHSLIIGMCVDNNNNKKSTRGNSITNSLLFLDAITFLILNENENKVEMNRKSI